ncbi:hypothetical protein MK280_10510, partial [Myxococcota bacterium]|nr:hypothetical protein [Myxococcota bacterium]
KYMDVDWNDGALRLDARGSIECLYGDCSNVDQAYAIRRLSDEPLSPIVQPLCLSEGWADRLPAVYIECLRDQTVSPNMQRQMQQKRSFRDVLSLDSGHSPFFSQPAHLAQLLESTSEHINPSGPPFM